MKCVNRILKAICVNLQFLKMKSGMNVAILEMNAGHHDDDFPPKGLEWNDIPEDLPIPDYTKLK